jgi:CDP-6-deoxy-D-xylo-4-hexulose-3-dehydrase
MPTLEQVEAAITPRTGGIVLAHTLGCPLPRGLRELADARGLFLVDDCCDALGSPDTFIGHASTLSFYPAHQICAGEGGAVLVDNPALAKVVRSLREWGRDCWCEPGHDNTCGKRFDGDYDHKYTYSRIGYHLGITEFEGALGNAQMDRLEEFIFFRSSNHNYLWSQMKEKGLDRFFIFPPDDLASWFGFALICKLPILRNSITQWLEGEGIQTRLVFGGNLTRQPAFRQYAGTFPNADKVHFSAFWVGCWPGLDKAQLDFIVESISDFVGGTR